MKKYLTTTALLSCLSATPGLADSVFSIGLSVPLNGKEAGSVGVSAHVLSGKKQDTWAAAAGVTYFPKNQTWGVDVGLEPFNRLVRSRFRDVRNKFRLISLLRAVLYV